MSNEKTPSSSGKRSFSNASLSPTSPSSSHLEKKPNMSVDVDSLIAALTDERVKSVLTSSYTAALTAELKKRDSITEALQSEVQQLKTELHELKQEKARRKSVWRQNWTNKSNTRGEITSECTSPLQVILERTQINWSSTTPKLLA